ncbi:hypothetical protein [Sorangium sp. So ce341]|uniref:hypothetical protein n=1 Tax=Sorangium sp. So ce341 TaxID=3133302 RepID=UPI003F61D984
MRARFSVFHSFVAVALALCAHGCGGAPRPDPQPAPPPSDPVIVTGNGELVSATFGPKGGRLNLAGDGPSVGIPVDAARQGGISITMRKEAPFTPASGTRLGDSFRVTLMLDPPSGGSFSVLSAPVVALPPGCTETNIELGVERPGAAAPVDGHGSSSLVWEYVPASFAASHATSRVPRIWPYRLQFLCGRVR